MKDEAAKSTFKSSKRLWQGDGQKLRNSPVEFVKALESYDPGEFLREQLEANARRMAAADAAADVAPADAPKAEILEVENGHAAQSHEDMDIREPISSEDEDLEGQTLSAATSDEDSADESDDAFTRAADAYYSQTSDIGESDPSKPSEAIPESSPGLDASTAMPDLEHRGSLSSSACPPDLDVSSAVDKLHLSEPAPKVNFDLVLESLNSEIPDVELEDSVDEGVGSNEQEFSIRHSNEPSSTEDVVFIIDVEGDRSMPHSSSVSQIESVATPETIDFKPRHQATRRPSTGVKDETESTPWARTIDDPVYGLSEVDRNPVAIGHAFEGSASSKRGKRGGIQKRMKQGKNARQSKRGDFEIMFDYMENAKWTDTDSEVDSLEEGHNNDAAEPLINELLAGLGPPRAGIDDLVEDDGELSSSDSERADDSDIDDDLELMIDAEMEEMEFDLGYSRGRGSKGRRYGADREIVDAALYHDDFNVYDYNIDDEEQGSGGEIEASGANKRGLNKFINDLDLSDEELEATLIAQWKKDRGSKKDKKRERQRLHQDGLIGKKAKRARASHEMEDHGSNELDSVHEHIKRFVTHEDYHGIEELPMPAMEKPTRRAAHLISQAYGLKSASQGSGKRRYITFYKTKHTAVLPDADFLEETMVRARRSLGFNSKYRDRLLPEAARQKLGRSGKPMKTRSGGAGGAGRLRDGDLVGADAPEIATQNRGRQMLEKLGWLQGSGLGAIGNQGMNVPLFATIKNTKAGL